METMKAVRIHRYGGPEVLQYEDAPRPEPGLGEVLIRVHAAGVNPIDWKTCDGYLKEVMAHCLPITLGWDCAGVVEAVGTQTRRLKQGDMVYCFIDLARPAAYAEYAVVKESEAALKPQTIAFVEAAAIPLAGLTAWQALFDVAALTAGQSVLIHAAAGGVGHFAVQLAKWRGAYVIGTASGRNHEFLTALGADEVIDYKKTGFEERVHNVDVVLDGVGGEVQARSWKVLKPNGILVSITSIPSPDDARAHHVRQTRMLVRPNAPELAEMAALVDSGRLRPVVETILPLSEARLAHELSRKGHTRGKIVLRP